MAQTNQIDPRSYFPHEATIGGSDANAASFDEVTPKPRSPARLSQQALEVAALFSDRPISRRLLIGAVRALELLILVGLGIATLDPVALPTGEALGLPILSAGVAVLFIQAFDGYEITTFRSFSPQIGRVVAAWTLVFAAVVALEWLAHGDGVLPLIGPAFARWFAAGLTSIVIGRAVLRHLVLAWTRDGRLERRAVIVGGGSLAEDLIRRLEAQPGNDIRICGIFDDRDDDRSPPMVEGYPKLGTITELVEFGRITRLDMLIVTLPLTAMARVRELLKKLWVLPVDIRLSAHADRLRFRPRNYSYEGSLPFLDVVDKPLADWDAVAKRAFDLLLGSMALIALSPVMLATAIAVKLDSRGPVFFRQKRFGFNNQVISIWKFRSMYVDDCDYEAKHVVTRGDPRVTRVGRFIRKASIDELPQLFNVLAGELSLVGPRPHALNAQTEDRMWDVVIEGYFARHKVKPGVTGWAQINGWRGEIDTPEKIRKRIEHDIYYIENWSVAFDLWILLLTPLRLFDTRNAY
jgi:Undecaprenyl-phosphate glucose phosphotransferase